jgi:hypothetical protein
VRRDRKSTTEAGRKTNRIEVLEKWNMFMTLRISVLSTLFLALGSSVYSCWANDKPDCKQRAEAYKARVEQLTRDAREELGIGIRQDVVRQFFEAHGLPFKVVRQGDHNEAIGTIYVQGGCAPRGCGSEDALIGLRVELGLDGSLISEPVIGSQFTNCL